ncbi:endonuclease MutS2, partial [Aduncisulcus paluster]
MKLGLSPDVIGAARALVKQDDIEFEEILTTIEENRKTSEAEKDEAIRLRLEVEKLKKKLEEKEIRLNDQRDKLVSKAKDEARAILKKAKDESEEIIKELRGLQT